jgi:hypothetical protein
VQESACQVQCELSINRYVSFPLGLYWGLGKQLAQAVSMAQVWRRQRRGRVLSNMWACSLVLSCPIDDEAAAAARRRRRAPPNPSINQVAWGTDDAKVPAGPAPCGHPACPLPDNAVVEASLSCLARTIHHQGTGVGLIDGHMSRTLAHLWFSVMRCLCQAANKHKNISAM